MTDATHAGFADADRGCHGTRAPVVVVGRFVAGRDLHHALNQAGADLGLPPRSGRIFFEPSQAQSQVAPAPAGNLFGSHSQVLGNGFVLLPGGGSQNDAGAFDDARRKRSGTGALLERSSLPGTQFDGWGNSHSLTSPEH